MAAMQAYVWQAIDKEAGLGNGEPDVGSRATAGRGNQQCLQTRPFTRDGHAAHSTCDRRRRPLSVQVAEAMYSLESGPQLRAARAMAGIDRQRLANAAGVAVQTVRRLEGLARIRATTTTVESLQRALEAAGVEFLPGGGVRPREQPAA